MDPDSLDPDPDPAFHVNPDPDTDPVPEHQALQKMKFINCSLFFWAIFALPDTDPQHWL